jgi:hypothetical protein
MSDMSDMSRLNFSETVRRRKRRRSRRRKRRRFVAPRPDATLSHSVKLTLAIASNVVFGQLCAVF